MKNNTEISNEIIGYAFYSKKALDLYGHCIWRVNGEEKVVTSICIDKEELSYKSDKEYLGPVRNGDFILACWNNNF
jgi:hypothetical protein